MPTRHRVAALLAIFFLALVVRTLTAYFVGSHLDDPGWFPFGIYRVFDTQAQGILDGNSPMFWISDATQTTLAVYPPGYPLWISLIYGISGTRSPHAVQIVQTFLDAGSVLLIAAIATSAFKWGVGVAAGFLAALSPLLAFYGATPLADSPTSWVVLAGVWMLVRSAKRESLFWAIAAGIMIGASCWFRANALFMMFIWAFALFVSIGASLRVRLALASCVLAGALIAISPVVVRNSVAFQAFVPTGLGVGTNLWEGIGETSRAEEFGAVYGDSELLKMERIDLGLPNDESVTLYWPDGVQRDRERFRKAIRVIGADPVWYAGVMLRRMFGLLQFAGEDSPVYGTTGINVTVSKTVPQSWRILPLNIVVTILGYAQSVLRYILLPLMVVGLWGAVRENWRNAVLIFATVFYFLVFGTFLHSEIRYSLPMQSVLFVFAGFGLSMIISAVLSRTHAYAKTGQS